MATHMGSLNPEPSLPSEREQLDLPAKSYAEASHENLDVAMPIGQATTELYAGQGEDEAPRTPKRNMHRKSGSLRANGHPKGSPLGKQVPDVTVERFEDKDGEHLVSLRPGWEGEDRKLPSRESEGLVSGKKAGARWAQSP